MKTLLKNMYWMLSSKTIKQDLLAYCKLEYPNEDVSYALNKMLAIQKANYFGNSNA